MTHRRASCRACAPSAVLARFRLQYPAAWWRSCVRNAPRYGTLMAQLQHVDRAEPGRLRGAAASEERQLVELVEHLASFQSRSRRRRVMPRAVSDLLGRLPRQRPDCGTLSNGSTRSLRSSVVVGGRLSGCAGAVLDPMTALLPRRPSQDLILRSTAFTTSPRSARLAKGIRSPVRASLITGAIKWGDANFAFPQLRRLSGHTPWPPVVADAVACTSALRAASAAMSLYRLPGSPVGGDLRWRSRYT